jgi:hypothetical protein
MRWGPGRGRRVRHGRDGGLHRARHEDDGRIDPGADPDPDAGKLHKAMNHCGYCAVHAATYGLPPPMTAVFAPAAGRDAWPPLYYRSSRILFPWALAQPRAPPAVS